MKRSLGLALTLVLASGSLAGAQVTRTTNAPDAPGATDVTAGGEMRRMSQLLGSTVQLQGADNFGRVDDAVIDENGAVAYLVVASNGRHVMLPWSEANFNNGRRVVTYSVAPQAIQPLYFESKAWPNVWGPQYMTRVRQVFPRAGVIRREVLRPAAPGVPAGSALPLTPGGVIVQPPGTALPPGTSTLPAGAVIDQKVKVQRDGDIKVKERIR